VTTGGLLRKEAGGGGGGGKARIPGGGGGGGGGPEREAPLSPLILVEGLELSLSLELSKLELDESLREYRRSYLLRALENRPVGGFIPTKSAVRLILS